MVVIDSGLGGLSVVRALRAQQPGLPLFYAADTAAFPYGQRSAADITARAAALIETLQARHALQCVVLACNTLSTLALAALRTRFPALHFVGTVPAIKVAAQQSRTRRFTLLATPNTAHSAYSRQLVAEFAGDCVVDGYGAPRLAAYAEATLLGDRIDAEAWRAEIAPAFFDDARGKTDAVILGCTHYPLVLDMLRAHAPWPVAWIDSSAAIARQALRHCPSPAATQPIAYITGADADARYAARFAAEGFALTQGLAVAATPALPA
jgi:glutamate racemase